MIRTSDAENLASLQSGRILGVDYGESRIGLSLSDPMQILASSLKTITNSSLKQVVDEFDEIVKEHKVSAMVVGRPVHMSGETSKMVEKIQKFVEQLTTKIHIPIFLWDERWTTVSAEKLMHELGHSPSKQRHKIDQVAASFLLQNFLDRLASVRRQRALTE